MRELCETVFLGACAIRRYRGPNVRLALRRLSPSRSEPHAIAEFTGSFIGKVKNGG